MTWYVLYTTPRAEKRVEERLRQMGVEVFLPIHVVKRKWSDRMKLVEVPLFNSYVFVRCKNEHEVRGLVSVYGVVRVVYYLGRPAVVREDEIDAIREFLLLAREREIIVLSDEVEIAVGPFEKRRGKVIELSSNYAKLYLEELGAKISVSLHDLTKTGNLI